MKSTTTRPSHHRQVGRRKYFWPYGGWLQVSKSSSVVLLLEAHMLPVSSIESPKVNMALYFFGVAAPLPPSLPAITVISWTTKRATSNHERKWKPGSVMANSIDQLKSTFSLGLNLANLMVT